jgi:hypothetical protein
MGPAWPCCVVRGRHGRGWQAPPGPAPASGHGPAPCPRHAPAGQLLPHPPVPVRARRNRQGLPYRGLSSSLLSAVGAFRPRPPFIEPGPLHLPKLRAALEATSGMSVPQVRMRTRKRHDDPGGRHRRLTELGTTSPTRQGDALHTRVSLPAPACRYSYCAEELDPSGPHSTPPGRARANTSATVALSSVVS